MFKQLLVPFLNYKFLLLQLILREIKARYKQSVIGYAWIIFNPLVQLLIYSFVFSVIFKFPTGDIPYAIFLLTGLLPWIYLQLSLSASTLVLVDNSNLLKKVAFPREILPYSIIFSKFVDFFLASLILVVFIVFYQLPIQLIILMVIPIFIIQVILMTGLALFLSSSNLFYRDIQYVTSLLLLMWMYLTPVVYPLSLVPKNYVWLYKLNPMVGIIEGYRSAIFNLPFDWGTILCSLFSAIIIFILGFVIFKKGEKVFADIV